MTIAHFDEVAGERGEAGHLAGVWYDLGSAAGSATVGLQRVLIDPGKWSTPAHVELAEEEIFYVLAGAGLSWLPRRRARGRSASSPATTCRPSSGRTGATS